MIPAKSCYFGISRPERIYEKSRYQFRNYNKNKVEFEMNKNIVKLK